MARILTTYSLRPFTMENAKKKKKLKNLTFLPKYDIGPDLAEYVSTYAALLKFSKRARERCYL